MRVSLALLSWKRIDGIKYVVNWALVQDMIDDIVIWNNNADIDLREHLPCDDRVVIINNKDNIMCYGRWLAVSKCKHDHVYVQDDDFIPGDLNKLHQLYTQSECNVVAYCAPSHTASIPTMKFVGFGSIVNKTCVPGIFDKYINRFGEDFLLYRECDLLVTNMSTYEKHVANIVTLKNSAHDMNAMHRQPKHYDYHADMVNRSVILKNE